MDKDRGFVIAFHNNEGLNPYLGLSCRDRAIRNLKRYIPSDIVARLRRRNDKKVLIRMSLEAGIINCDEEVLSFIQKKIRRGEPIFLDFKEKDAIVHNESKHAQRFLIASIHVSASEFTFLNSDIFSPYEVERIIEIVEKSQEGILSYAGTVANGAVNSSEKEVVSHENYAHARRARLS